MFGPCHSVIYVVCFELPRPTMTKAKSSPKVRSPTKGSSPTKTKSPAKMKELPEYSPEQLDRAVRVLREN
ncbi:hypothetical protein PR003_g12187 [Phytophthora rubi]|uniref:Uncharacterized protein n=1 Tax=Phytophthora rubi TaxID=129364 RepID=A0A6A4F0X6_9STRA|nr:hypothetical protein PR002_g11694 [Phytophthora rubi]KAE9337069.1 hypothetical protein PR003_g12187 [Phytophthora rubi]